MGRLYIAYGVFNPLFFDAFSRMLFVVVDVDECATNNGGCHQTCNNTIGSFSCSCLTGWMLSANNKACDGEWYLNIIIIILINIIEGDRIIIITNSQTSRAARSLNSVVTSRGVPACVFIDRLRKTFAWTKSSLVIGWMWHAHFHFGGKNKILWPTRWRKRRGLSSNTKPLLNQFLVVLSYRSVHDDARRRSIKNA